MFEMKCTTLFEVFYVVHRLQRNCNFSSLRRLKLVFFCDTLQFQLGKVFLIIDCDCDIARLKCPESRQTTDQHSSCHVAAI